MISNKLQCESRVVTTPVDLNLLVVIYLFSSARTFLFATTINKLLFKIQRPLKNIVKLIKPTNLKFSFCIQSANHIIRYSVLY